MKDGALTIKRAHLLVRDAVRSGVLKRLDGSIPCADCGRPAKMYDHRDYEQPIEVEPVCARCNVRRGQANNHPLMDELIQRNKRLRMQLELAREHKRNIAEAPQRVKLTMEALDLSVDDLAAQAGLAAIEVGAVLAGNSPEEHVTRIYKACRILAVGRVRREFELMVMVLDLTGDAELKIRECLEALERT